MVAVEETGRDLANRGKTLGLELEGNSAILLMMMFAYFST